MVACLPIAQFSWVMTQPAASGPAKYISSAGLDHTASPSRPGTTRLSLWAGPRAEILTGNRYRGKGSHPASSKLLPLIDVLQETAGQTSQQE